MLYLWSHNLRLILEHICSPTRTCLGKEALSLKLEYLQQFPPRIVKADGREAHEADDKEAGASRFQYFNPNWTRLCWRSPHLYSNSPAARTSLLLMVPVLLIACSCHDLACLLFACSRHQLSPAISCWLKSIRPEYSGNTQTILVRAKNHVFCKLQAYLLSAFWFWLSPCRQFPFPDLEYNQPAV